MLFTSRYASILFLANSSAPLPISQLSPCVSYYWTPPGDPDGHQRAILHILRDPELQEVVDQDSEIDSSGCASAFRSGSTAEDVEAGDTPTHLAAGPHTSSPTRLVAKLGPRPAATHLVARSPASSLPPESPYHRFFTILLPLLAPLPCTSPADAHACSFNQTMRQCHHILERRFRTVCLLSLAL